MGVLNPGWGEGEESREGFMSEGTPELSLDIHALGFIQVIM